MTTTMTLDGVQIAFDESGTAAPGPALVLLTGWCHDHRYYDRLVDHLLPDHRVIRVSWRGHGPDRTPVPDFGVSEQVTDTIALLDTLGVDTFVPVSHAHGGWVAMDMAEKLGPERVPRLMLVDLIMTRMPPEFRGALRTMQDPGTWQAARLALVDSWLADSSHEVVSHYVNREGGFGYDMWARCCRVIESAYDHWGSPMARMEQLTHPRPVRHVFSHPKIAAYDELHEEFAARHDWFSFTRLDGETHFPALELPAELAREVDDFLR
ncbi:MULTISPECIES: alpha/beta hydrolase [Streptomyces]|uniref:Alpha/beta hydrolase n=1 Tax=Streptomyces lichenis TaxID=2306967 RepID=A0ABT0IAU9_9ACTN|nr:alpha/beta hydrolase [Streptomyces lichenis]MCK8678443.1 alpha/beta hydrolase [Streptomyces lichenis]